MLLYLSGHTRPGIVINGNHCARYMFSPNISHEFSLKRLERYLKNTQVCGLVLDNNSYIFKVDAYPDADFTGMYGHEKHNDPACAKSCTGSIITFYDCPVLWVSKLQTATALYTKKSEIIALAQCCQDLFPIIYITQSMGKLVGLPVKVPLMCCKIVIPAQHKHPIVWAGIQFK